MPRSEAIEFHEAANIFPLDEEHLPDLANDIRENGQQVAIELLDGKIIDGRRRFKACEIAGVKPKFRDVIAADPVAYVLSLNLHRRHLSPSQLAMVGARAREIYDEQAKERQKRKPVNSVVGTLPQQNGVAGKSRDLAGKAVGVSGSLVDAATKVIEHAVPELAQAVDEGRLSVSSAAKIANEDEDVQREIATKATFSGGRYRKPAVEPKDDEEETREIKGVGVIRANEAINCLTRIPKNDALRKRGFQIVTDWIKHNM